MTERVCVFIDGSNFYHLCKDNLKRTDIDIGAFASWLVSPSRTLVRTYYYNCLGPPDRPEEARLGQQKFFGVLDHTPYLEVRLGRLVQRDWTCASCKHKESHWIEKGLDMRIGVDMLSTGAKGLYETAILVSGDGDLAEAVKAVKDLGKHVEVTAFQKGTSNELIKAADLCRDLTPAHMTQFFLRT